MRFTASQAYLAAQLYCLPMAYYTMHSDLQAHGGVVNTRLALVPPKPKEFDITAECPVIEVSGKDSAIVRTNIFPSDCGSSFSRFSVGGATL